MRYIIIVLLAIACSGCFMDLPTETAYTGQRTGTVAAGAAANALQHHARSRNAVQRMMQLNSAYSFQSK